jgi:hypothetical protein
MSTSSLPSLSNTVDKDYLSSETAWSDKRDLDILPTGLQATLGLHHDVKSAKIRGLFCVTEEKQIVFTHPCLDIKECPAMFRKIARDLHTQRPMVPLRIIEELFDYQRSDFQGFKWEMRASGDPPNEWWMVED